MMKHENIMNYHKLFKYLVLNELMDTELVKLCSICIENEPSYLTECNHGYCISCLSRINKCALCRKVLQRSLICVEIKRKVKRTNNTIITNPNPNVYSFALRPEDYQPSGPINFSRINDVELTITSSNYNLLRIMSGMGGLAYST